MSLDLTFLSQFFQPLIWVKMTLLLFLLFYASLSFVILNQVRVMNRIIKEVRASTIFFLFAILNFLMAFSLFLLALVIL